MMRKERKRATQYEKISVINIREKITMLYRLSDKIIKDLRDAVQKIVYLKAFE